MKKIFAVLAIAGLMASCNSKKKDETKGTTTETSTDNKTTTPDNTTTTPDNTTTTTTTTTTVTGVPNFSDPEVQKFANDYAAFIEEYKKGLKDPAKLMELSKNMQDWATRAQSIGMKLANNPEEAKKWTDWTTAISKELTDATMKMNQ